MDTLKKMSTICAISTPYGSGGIAVIRISGKSAIAIADSIFHAKKIPVPSFEMMKRAFFCRKAYMLKKNAFSTLSCCNSQVRASMCL